MGRFLVDGVNNFYYNSDELCLEFITVKGRIKKRENKVRNGINYGSYYISLGNGRRKILSYPIYYFHVKYFLGIDVKDKIVLFNDGDKNNILFSNIVINSIYDICDKWKDIDERYKLSINGDVYDSVSLCLVEHPLNGVYFKICGKTVHHMVWELFSGKDIEDGYVIDHIDNNIYNNRLDNLQMITQGENIKKERNINLDRNFTYNCTYNGKSYNIYSNYGKKYSRFDHEKIYNNFITICKNGKIDDYFIGGDIIKYDFLECKWRIVHIPLECRNGLKKSDFFSLRFDKYVDAEKWLNKNCDMSKRIDFSDRFNFFKSRNEIFFRYKDRHYSFNLTGGIDNNFDSDVINLFLDEGKEVFVDRIEELRNQRENIIRNHKDVLKEKRFKIYKEKIESSIKIKTKLMEEKVRENDIKKEEFNSAPNYSFFDGVYYFAPHYNGKSYPIGSLYNKSIVIEFNELIEGHKLDNTFIEWYESGRLSYEWSNYKEIDSKIRLNNEKSECKGYKRFGPKNCWRSLFRLNGKEYFLGYFKSENSCKAIYSEACKMLELGVLDAWYSDIKQHRERIKKYFE